jgi:uncharacterized protein with PIN domain
MKFLCDRDLGRLAKWLRILGYDTLHAAVEQDFFDGSRRTGRVALTRSRRRASRSCPEPTLLIRAARVQEQIGEIVESLALKPDPRDRMTLCLHCNRTLVPAAQEEAEGQVPAYVFHQGGTFKKCPECGRVVWPGTHPARIGERLRGVLKGSQSEGERRSGGAL